MCGTVWLAAFKFPAELRYPHPKWTQRPTARSGKQTIHRETDSNGRRVACAANHADTKRNISFSKTVPSVECLSAKRTSVEHVCPSNAIQFYTAKPTDNTSLKQMISRQSWAFIRFTGGNVVQFPRTAAQHLYSLPVKQRRLRKVAKLRLMAVDNTQRMRIHNLLDRRGDTVF